MKKASRKSADGLRPEYKRSDFTSMVRGKYAGRAAQVSNKQSYSFPSDDELVRAADQALRELDRREIKGATEEGGENGQQ
jgi:hypothetical protein